MNDEAFNMSIRRFLKVVGIRSQSEIERAVAKALADGKIKGNAAFPARMRLTIEAVGLDITLDGEIQLE
jgi:hypothetical protein